MPNHIHGIIFVHKNDRADASASARRGTIYRAPTLAHRAPTSAIEQFGKPAVGSLSTIIRTFKAAITRRAGRELNSGNIWQRNYACRALSGITNTSSTTRPITNASPVTSSIPHFVGLTRSTGIRMRRIPKTLQEQEMLQREIESTDSRIDRPVSPSPPTGMLREGGCRDAAARPGRSLAPS
jgi:hypothetical protein